MKLTPEQIAAAKALLAARPPAYDGTRVVADITKRNRWYDDVRKAMKQYKVPYELTGKFCDLAGVPD